MNQTSMALVSPCCPFPMRRRLFVRPRFDGKDYWHWLHLLIDNSVKADLTNPTKRQTPLPRLPPVPPKIGDNIWLAAALKPLLSGLQEALCLVCCNVSIFAKETVISQSSTRTATNQQPTTRPIFRFTQLLKTQTCRGHRVKSTFNPLNLFMYPNQSSYLPFQI